MKNLTVNLKEKSYPIHIKKGLLNDIEKYLNKNSRHFVITNDTIYKHYQTCLDKFEYIILIKDGEEYKNFDTYKFILDKLLEAKIERSDVIIAFGGGVVGDLAGFAASSILRGVDFIQIPTTLLSHVDSSVGGKTGFNHSMGKNLIGAFYQPKMVLIDTATLDTLDSKQIKTGLGEVLKYALIQNTIFENCTTCENFDLFDYLNKVEKDNLVPFWEELIYMCVNLKAMVVCADEKEKGIRSVLNFGHTFGHAIEKITGYKKYAHGEAVALGMIMAYNYALKRNLITQSTYNKARSFIEGFNLISTVESFDKNAVYDAMKSDKKVEHSKIRLVLPVESNSKHFGSVSLFDDSSETLIKDSVI